MSFLCVIENWEKENKNLKVSDFFKLEKKFPFAILYGKGNYIIFGEKPLKIFNEIPSNITFLRKGELPEILPDLIGFVSYETGYKYDYMLPEINKTNFPLTLFFLFKELKIYSKNTKTLYICKREINQDTEEEIKLPQFKETFKASFINSSESPKSYMEKVAYIKEEIKKGNVYQANLTRQEEWSFKGNITQFAFNLYRKNPASFSVFFHFFYNNSIHYIVSSSPERFFKIEKDTIYTEPIKGTIKRGETKREDYFLKKQLVNNEKETAELAMITDLLRNDLTRVCICPSVKVEEFKKLITLSNVHHLVSIISGKLKTNNLKTIFREIFPGGSITGCPKLPAMNLIYALEKMPRNIYTGSIGWCRIDGKQADFNIAIRTAYTIQDKLYFGVGGGIVIDSDEKKEYLETVYKAQSIRSCLENT